MMRQIPSLSRGTARSRIPTKVGYDLCDKGPIQARFRSIITRNDNFKWATNGYWNRLEPTYSMKFAAWLTSYSHLRFLKMLVSYACTIMDALPVAVVLCAKFMSD